MTEPRERILQRLFAASIERSAGDRAAFLGEACAGDDALRAEVQSLLDADARAGGFLSRPAEVSDPADAPDDPDAAEPMIGRTIGPWRVTRRIGRGGMGTVYLAERHDAVFEGRAAIKIIRHGMDSEDVLARFHQERRVLGLLQHPGIARLFDGGALDDGLPYFVMEYVDGEPLDVSCDRRGLGLADRIRLFLEVCDAVQFAHQNLVVHRDLKPANVLVTSEGRVRLLDFGIAKLLAGDESGAVLTHGAAGPFTPHYASPEQLGGGRVTTASDVYSLGVLLYELLVGASPFSGRSDLSRRGRTVGAPSQGALRTDTVLARRSGGARALSRRLAGDLDAIVLAATREEPERRYQTAREMADDVHRYLEEQPVRARRGALGYRMTKFVRRNAAGVAAGAALGLALIVGTATSTVLYLQSRASQREADRERAVANEVSRFLEGVLSQADPHQSQGRDVALLREILDRSSQRMERELAPGSRVAGALHLSMGTTYRHLALLEPAERHLRLALAVFDADTTLDRSRRIRAHFETGSLLFDTGRYAEAADHLDRAMALATRAGPAERDPLLAVVSMLGQVEEARGDAASAEARYREAIAMARATHGAAHPQVAARLSDLSVLLMNHQRGVEADTMMRAAVEIWRGSSVPVDSLEFATGLHNFAGLLRRQTAYDEAARHYGEALEIYRRFYVGEHTDIARTLNAMGSNEEAAGRLAAAEPLYREALAMQRRLLGSDHRDVGTTLNNLAGMLRKAGRLDEADREFGRATRIYRTALGSDHPWLAIVLTNHAATLELMRDWVRLGPMVEEAAALAKRRMPADHPQHAILASLRGAWLASAGRTEEAAELLATSHRALADSLGADHPNTLDAARRLEEFRGRRMQGRT